MKKLFLTPVLILSAVLLILPMNLCAQADGGRQPAQNDTPVRDFALCPADTTSTFEGWGISLCWWARMCGEWSDDKIDQLVDWLVSPDKLNFRIFRYNIGGGEDPLNRNCQPHHMGKGKGLRAEMEGFKDSTADAYHWERDAAQRKIMLKIKQKRPDAIFEAFSNSCPYYMTVSGCVGGADKGNADNLLPQYYKEFAHYLVDVCKHYKDEYGIEFATLEPFNEAMSDYWYRDGSQEGCHFDKESQVKFLRVLSPVLRASGLKTVISASDETSVKQSVEALEHYRDAGVLPLVGQWNTHTYIADNTSRDALRRLCHDTGMKLWMSEVGSGGKGLEGNIELAQKLIDDMRHLEPTAWIDWQYVEENNDQWCLVQGDFKAQTYHRVKNYYVRQQFSRFIPQGYRIVRTACPQALAAVSPDGKEFVVVMINGKSDAVAHNIDVKALGKGIKAECFRTSETEDVAPVSQFTLKKGTLSCTLPPLSVTTVIMKRK